MGGWRGGQFKQSGWKALLKVTFESKPEEMRAQIAALQGKDVVVQEELSA